MTQAASQSISRRGAFAAGIGLPVIFSALAAAAPNDAEVLYLATEAQRLLDAIDNPSMNISDDMGATLSARSYRYQALVLAAPTTSAAVAAYQLRFGAKQHIEIGPRADGLERAALDRVLAWLEAR